MGGDLVETAVAAVVALTGGLAMFLLFRWSPRTAVVLWAATMFFTPIWTKVSFGGVNVTAMIGVTILAILASRGRRVGWTPWDTLMVVLVVALVIARVFGHSVWGHFTDVVMMWLIPFVWGRRILARVSIDWVSGCIAAAAGLASLGAIFEWFTGQNVFLLLPGASTSVWFEQAERAGLLRAEGAFGHSIALGGTLGMTVPFILTVRWPAWLRFVVLAVTGTACVLTFSRLGLIGFALTVLASIILLGPQMGRAMRLFTTIVLVLAVAIGAPLVLDVFGQAGTEASGSAEYRVDLLDLVGSIGLFGVSSAHTVLPTGVDYWAGFRSIDSAMILVGLQFGAVPLAIMLVLLVALVIGVLRRPSVASVALVTQIPAFATVALITQYASFVWFVGGLALALASARESASGTEDSSEMASEFTSGVTHR